MTIDGDVDAERWNYHPDRESVISEPHARPSLPVSPTDLIVHLGFSCSKSVTERLLIALDGHGSVESQRYLSKVFGNVRVKLEHHTEFVTLTCIAAGSHKHNEIYKVIDSLLFNSDLEMIVMAQVVMCEDASELQKLLSDNHTVYGGTMRGKLNVRSTLTPNVDGCLVYFAYAETGSNEEVGRRIQRLLEMETYRTMCLLGLPVARRTGQKLLALEDGINRTIARMNSDHDTETQELFNELTQLSKDSNKLLADTRFRFSASGAYYNLTQQRLESLEEAKSSNIQTISGFVRSRLAPGNATINSIAKRQATLAADLNNALSLLRTQVDLGINRDNQALLQSMDARHRQQIVIAQAVEGLSAVAITYYAIGLLSYVIKGTHYWLPFSQNAVIAMAVPLILVGIWSFLRFKRTKWEREVR